MSRRHYSAVVCHGEIWQNSHERRELYGRRIPPERPARARAIRRGWWNLTTEWNRANLHPVLRVVILAVTVLTLMANSGWWVPLLLPPDIAKKSEEVKIISFSRNFGHQPAISAGIRGTVGIFEETIALILPKIKMNTVNITTIHLEYVKELG